MSGFNEQLYIGLYKQGKDDMFLAQKFNKSKRTIERINQRLRSEDKIAYRKEMMPDLYEHNNAKILLFDIETSPMLGWVWGLFKQFISLDQLALDWNVLCYAGKWLGTEEVFTDAIINYQNDFTPFDIDDYGVISSVWELFNEADTVVAHNAGGFDCGCLNAKFVEHGFPPPRPYKIIDTLKVAKAKFKFTSNKLEYLSKKLGFSGKLEHEGFNLWKKCMYSDLDAWSRMVDYNKVDVIQLEGVYLKLRSWDSRHPDVIIENDKIKCKTCGSANLEKNEKPYQTAVSHYNLYKCRDCGSWNRSRYNIKTKDEMKNTLMGL